MRQDILLVLIAEKTDWTILLISQNVNFGPRLTCKKIARKAASFGPTKFNLASLATESALDWSIVRRASPSYTNINEFSRYGKHLQCWSYMPRQCCNSIGEQSGESKRLRENWWTTGNIKAPQLTGTIWQDNSLLNSKFFSPYSRDFR